MNLFYYIFYRSYSSKLRHFHEDEFLACFYIGCFISMNILTAGIYMLSFLNIRPIILSFYSINSLLVIAAINVGSFYWFLKGERYKRILGEYSKKGRDRTTAFSMWTYIILSTALYFGAVMHVYDFDDNLLNREPVRAPAGITATNIRRSTGRSTHSYFFRYEFEADGKRYSNMSDQAKCKEKLFPGDSLAIVYARSAPEVSGLVRYEDGSLILKRKSP